MTAQDYFHSWLSEAACYEWAKLFASPWEELVQGMAAKADAVGLSQEAGEHHLTWTSGGRITAKFVFVDDPSDLTAIRRVFTDEYTPRVPACFVVVRQPDTGDTRGDVIFDIFKLSPRSYLAHENRVYTPPRIGAA